MKLFFFTSSRKSDKCSVITIMTSTFERASALAASKFIQWGYKGKPKCFVI